MQVIVLWSTAVLRLVYIIKSASTEICDWNGKLRHFDKLSFKVVCDRNGKLRHFHNLFSELCIERNYWSRIQRKVYFIHPEGYCRIFIGPNRLVTCNVSKHFYFNVVDFHCISSVSASSKLLWSQELCTSPCGESKTAVVSRYSQGEWVRNFSGFKDFNISTFGNFFLNGLTYSSK